MFQAIDCGYEVVEFSFREIERALGQVEALVGPSSPKAKKGGGKKKKGKLARAGSTVGAGSSPALSSAAVDGDEDVDAALVPLVTELTRSLDLLSSFLDRCVAVASDATSFPLSLVSCPPFPVLRPLSPVPLSPVPCPPSPVPRPPLVPPTIPPVPLWYPPPYPQ